jgi:arginine N-succinyltransferase
MFIVRNANVDDVPALLRMAATVHSNNLPANEGELEEIVTRSLASFAGESELDDRYFTFILVDEASGEIAGTSAIIARRGTPNRPRLYLKVRHHEHYSDDLQDGEAQTTVQLMQDVDGVTEVGGLVLDPAYRGSGLGSFLSKVRFGFMGLHAEWFMNRLVAEVMGVLTPDGHTKLWDHLGGRFINMSYEEADVYSVKSKEFITSLFPKEEIYTSLMPQEARDLLGAVSPDAIPALRMLERLGFKQIDEVDPFDGGPYLTANRDSVPLIAAAARVELVKSLQVEGPTAFISTRARGHFRCVRSCYELVGGKLAIPSESIDALQVDIGETLGFTPDGIGIRGQRQSQSDSAAT